MVEQLKPTWQRRFCLKYFGFSVAGSFSVQHIQFTGAVDAMQSVVA